jgi:hypothetical protein
MGLTDECESEIAFERRNSNQISVFGGNFQTFVRALGGHFEWGVYDREHKLRDEILELEIDISTLASEEKKVPPGDSMALGEEASAPIMEARRNIESRGKKIQEAIEQIYRASHLYVGIKPKKQEEPNKTTKSKRKAKE